LDDDAQSLRASPGPAQLLRRSLGVRGFFVTGYSGKAGEPVGAQRGMELAHGAFEP
jgi:hypothetical protein